LFDGLFVRTESGPNQWKTGTSVLVGATFFAGAGFGVSVLMPGLSGRATETESVSSKAIRTTDTFFMCFSFDDQNKCICRVLLIGNKTVKPCKGNVKDVWLYS
jgi:hypothetical protein